MKRRLFRLFALLLALSMVLSVLSGCDEEDWSDESAPEGAYASGLSVTVDRDSGEMTIERPVRAERMPMGEDGTWTVFVYLCGADLESRFLFGGSATEDLNEMCSATESDAVRFVIQTGGAKRWKNDSVDADESQRFVVEKGTLREVWSGDRADMGRSETLTDFLRWGVEEYPAQHMGVVLWDHGGGSVSGVCFDEQADDDGLSLRELDAAMLSVHERMTDQFAFVGFDACLMGTVETANLMASYADYMVASQETEPGCGWDYAAFGSYLAKHPTADGEEAGKALCKSYYAGCERIDCQKEATLSVIDLSRMDALMSAFNRFSKSMDRAGGDERTRSAMVRSIQAAESYGGSNKSEGYSNLVDLGGFITACDQYTEGGDEARAALEQAVVYSVSGSDHKKASGLSLYYPQSVPEPEELRVFQDICVSPYYLSFVDRQNHAAVSDADYEEGTWFSGGEWSLTAGYAVNEATQTYEYEPEEDDYWDFLEDFEPTGESERISFEEEPWLDEDGNYCFVLTPEALEQTADVYGCVYQASPDGEELLDLGETWDVEADWDEGFFASEFDGYWLSLPDGQNLALYVEAVQDDGVEYSSPILLNGEETNLRLRQSWNGKVKVEGVWQGVNENGVCDRTATPLQDGDVIEPLYDAISPDGEELDGYAGEPFTVDGRLRVDYELLEEGEFWYAFLIEDTCGDYYVTDSVDFRVEEDGSVTYWEE